MWMSLQSLFQVRRIIITSMYYQRYYYIIFPWKWHTMLCIIYLWFSTRFFLFRKKVLEYFNNANIYLVQQLQCPHYLHTLKLFFWIIWGLFWRFQKKVIPVWFMFCFVFICLVVFTLKMQIGKNNLSFYIKIFDSLWSLLYQWKNTQMNFQKSKF